MTESRKLLSTTLAVMSVSLLRCQSAACFRIAAKLRCIWSTPTEMQSMVKATSAVRVAHVREHAKDKVSKFGTPLFPLEVHITGKSPRPMNHQLSRNPTRGTPLSRKREHQIKERIGNDRLS
jgi:hypothetical protein